MESNILFDSFNARNLTDEAVANSFIPNDYFNKVIANDHSIIMGPRGCGKTTLLKMIKPATLYKYDKLHGTSLLTQIPFFAIYIPTDVKWKKEIEDFEEKFGKYTDLIQTIPKVLVNANIQHQMLETFSSLFKIIEPLNDEQQQETTITELCKDLITVWSLPSHTIPTFYSVQLEIFSRLNSINVLLNKLKITGQIPTNLPNYYFETFFELARAGCYAFNQHFSKLEVGNFKNKPNPFKWALCFDELELAPNWLQKELFESIRSRSQDFLLKLTSTPIILYMKEVEKQPEVKPSPADDYLCIKVWLYDNKGLQDWKDFGNRLISSKLKRKYLRDVSPVDILGTFSYELAISAAQSIQKAKDDLDEDEGSNPGIFEKGSPYLEQISELADKDPSFKRYLERHNIVASDPEPKNRLEQSISQRKIRPIVVFRNYFRGEVDKSGRAKKRTRNINPFYFGWSSVCKICDGNPRALIGMIDSILSKGENPDAIFVRPKEQTWVIYKISKRCLDIWKTHPGSTKVVQTRLINMVSILRQIGEYFRDEINYEDFKPNPTGTFIIDEDLGQKVLELMELALHLGAIVYLSPSEGLDNQSLVNKQFRLSYMLYPYFELPIRTEQSAVSLRNILKKGDSSGLLF